MLSNTAYMKAGRQDFVAGCVNEDTGLPDFEDVLRTGARVGQDFQPAH